MHEHGLEILVLGPIACRFGSGEPAAVPGQQGHVLALLAAAYPASVAVDALIEALWGDTPPSSARNGIGVVLHRLRGRLGGPETIAHEHNGYRLTVEADQFDVVRFRDQLQHAQSALDEHDTELASRHITAGLSLWSGDAYQPFDSTAVLQVASIELQEERLAAQDLMLDVLLGSARPDEAASWGQRLVAATPYRESRWVGLALSLYRAGRQAEALRSIAEASRVMRDEIGIEIGAELRDLERDILNQADHLNASPARANDHAAPAAYAGSEMLEVPQTARFGDPGTSFYGRHDDLETVAAMLDAQRCVTVVGPAGRGKTRFASRLARSAHQQVVWVDLAAQPDVDPVLALANQLGVGTHADQRHERIVHELKREPTLLVVDNCEHVAVELASLLQLISTAGDVCDVLATSRVPIGHVGESCYELPPLAADEGCRLLAERSYGRTAIGSNDQAELARLVERLDANPLLIELVAEPVRALSAAAVNQQLERVLVGAQPSDTASRHGSLAAAVDWSVRLLDPSLQELFSSLGVMTGTFSAGDVEKIIGRDRGAVESALESLCRHGLLAVDSGSATPTRYRQPEAIGIEARSRLRTKGDVARLETVHTDAYSELVAIQTDQLWTADESHAVRSLRDARGQLGAMHERLVRDGDVVRGAALAIAMWDYSFLRLELSQLSWAGDVLKLDGVAELPNYADLLATASMAAWAQHDYYESTRLADAAIEITGIDDAPLEALRSRFNVASFREPDLGPMQAFADLISATIARGEPNRRCDLEVLLTLGLSQIGDTAGTHDAAARALKSAEATRNPSCLAWAHYGSGWSKLDDDPVEAARVFLVAARLARQVENRFVEAMARGGLATSARRRGRFGQARALLAESITKWNRLQTTPQLIRTCREAVLLLFVADQHDAARVALTHLEVADLGHPLSPVDQQQYEDVVAELGYSDETVGIRSETEIGDAILDLLTNADG